VEELKRLIGLISVGLLVGLLGVGSSLAAQEITLSRGQTFTVHVGVYKPAGVSFPDNGAQLYAFLHDTASWGTFYNIGGYSANVENLTWGNEENQENFSLQITVSDDAPAGETVTLKVRLRLSQYEIYGGTIVTLNAVEIDGENTQIGTQGIPSWNDQLSLYTADIAQNVSIAPAEGAPISTTLIIGAVVIVIALLAVIAIVAKRSGGAGAPSPPETPEVER
jgi:hypothetical protein